MAKITNQDWVQRFRETHGDRYEYGEFTTNGKNRSIEIFCVDHGLFVKQLTNHWKGSPKTGVGGGCPECARGVVYHQSNRHTIDEWVARFKGAQPIEYDYSLANLTNGKVSIFVCGSHGEFRQTKYDHSQGRVGCLGCRIAIARDKFLVDARGRFGSVYDYSKFEYVNAKTKSVIGCPDHGSYVQNPDKHLSARYPCPVCNHDARVGRHKNGGGWYNMTAFRRSVELANKPAHVYYIKVGEHYKIGMTTKIQDRFRAIRRGSGKSIEILDTYECTALEAYILEQNILIRYGEYRSWSTWTTEIFERDVLKEQPLSGYRVDDEIYTRIP